MPIRNSNIAWQANPSPGKSWSSAKWPSPLVGILWKYSWHHSHVTLLRITLTTNSTTTKCGTKYTAQAIHKFAQCSIFVPGFGFQLSVFASKLLISCFIFLLIKFWYLLVICLFLNFDICSILPTWRLSGFRFCLQLLVNLTYRVVWPVGWQTSLKSKYCNNHWKDNHHQYLFLYQWSSLLMGTCWGESWTS